MRGERERDVPHLAGHHVQHPFLISVEIVVSSQRKKNMNWVRGYRE